MTSPSRKIAAARISVITATALALLKLVTGVLTGSLAVISSAVDSLLDILMSGINFVAIRHAEQPAVRDCGGDGKLTLFQASPDRGPALVRSLFLVATQTVSW